MARPKKKQPIGKFRVEFSGKLWWLQQEILDHLNEKILNPKGEPYRFFIPVCGRQVGKSYFARRVAADYSINDGKQVVWVSPSMPTARTHWNTLKKDLKKSGIPHDISEQAKEITFPNGGTIAVRSAIEPDNLRGLSPDLLILDEGAFFRNGNYVWYQVLLPMVTASRGKVLIPTTPNGRNWVYELYLLGVNVEDEYYKAWNVPSTASPFQDHKLLEHLRKNMPKNKWLREFEAKFLDDAGSIFTGAEDAAIVPMLLRPSAEHLRKGYYVAGGDFGFSNDFSTFTVVYVPHDGSPPQQVFGARWTDYGTLATVKKLWELLVLWKPKTFVMENNGIGNTLFRLLKEVVKGKDIDLMREVYQGEQGHDTLASVRSMIVADTKLIALHVDNSIKRDLVEDAATKIEYGRLDLLTEACDYGKTQLSEMSTYEREPTRTGQNITYNAAEGYNDDCVSALYLAVYTLPKSTKTSFEVIKGGSGDTESVNQDTKKKAKNPFKGMGKTLNGRRKIA